MIDVYVKTDELEENERSYFGVTAFVFLHSSKEYYTINFVPLNAIVLICSSEHIENGVSYENLIVVKDLKNETLKKAVAYTHETWNYLSTLLPSADFEELGSEYTKI